MKLYKLIPVVVLAVLLGTAAATASCSNNTSSPTTTTGTGVHNIEVVNSDSVVTAVIQSINKQTSGYAWKMDVMIQTALDVNNLPNPVAGDVGKVVTVYTDENLSTFKVNDTITGDIKYVGDVNTPTGISLYMSVITQEVKPAY